MVQILLKSSEDVPQKNTRCQSWVFQLHKRGSQIMKMYIIFNFIKSLWDRVGVGWEHTDSTLLARWYPHPEPYVGVLRLNPKRVFFPSTKHVFDCPSPWTSILHVPLLKFLVMNTISKIFKFLLKMSNDWSKRLPTLRIFATNSQKSQERDKTFSIMIPSRRSQIL